jgi:hypothetical protein
MDVRREAQAAFGSKFNNDTAGHHVITSYNVKSSNAVAIVESGINDLLLSHMDIMTRVR